MQLIIRDLIYRSPLNSDEVFASHYSFIDVYETIFMNFIRGIATSKGIMFIDEFVDRTENA